MKQRGLRVAHHRVAVHAASSSGHSVISVFMEPRSVDPDGGSRRYMVVPDELLVSIAERIVEYIDLVKEEAPHG